ncbi:MAG TPA: AAA family ATPase [Candidatus Limnocylindrales bacterium]|nr:AAA family ATPase [Candidatus Limnocylindrales bacterium]
MATTTTPVPLNRQFPVEPESPVRRVLMTAAYVLEHNLRRMIVLAIVIALFVFFAGSVRNALAGVIEFVGSLPSLLIGLVFSAFALIAQFAFLMFFLSKPRTYTVTPDQPQIGLSFENYRGQPDLLDHAKSLVRILQGQESFKKLGGDMPKGMLLAGQPGTGKTFLAGVVAAEANLPFIYVDASSLRAMWMGVDALMIMSLFGKARKLARRFAPPGSPGAAILFMDEIDSIGMARGGVQGGQMQTTGGFMGGMAGMGLNTLLNQMDSLAQHVEDRRKEKILRWLGVIRGPVPAKPVVFVMGATNRPDTLDPALVRPGRLDRRLNVYPPDGDGRRDILRHYLSSKAHDPNIDLGLMIQDSIGWTPIEIKTIINEALVIAHDAGRDFLTYKDWLHARDSRQLGIKQPITSMTADDKRSVAYHEAGHAVAARYLQQENRIQKASIIRMGDALGVVQRSPKEERYTYHAREIETDIMCALGSRAVEEVFLGTKMSGAGSDLQTATRLASLYVGTLGMGGSLLAVQPTMTGGLPPHVLKLADSLLDQLFEETKRLMKEKEYAVHAIAGALIQRGELIGPELDELFMAADLSNPEAAKPFEREPVKFDKVDMMESRTEGALAVAPPAAAQTADLPRPFGHLLRPLDPLDRPDF